MNNTLTEFLLEFSDIEDSRREHLRWYSISEILFLSLCGVLCGANDFEDIEAFGEAKLDFLRQYLPYKEGIPTPVTLRRVFAALDPVAFQERFIRWMARIHKGVAAEVIAVDGKTSRHTFSEDCKALHTVSAYAAEARLVIGQRSTDEKSNEITAIPELLAMLALDGKIVTIDAMGCQHKIADTITTKKGEYILALKGNQETLNDDVRTFLEDPEVLKTAPTTSTTDADHGRIETRTCTVTDDVEWLKERHPQWSALRSIIRIDATTESKGKKTAETRYYISSLAASPQKTLAAVRSHWAIENSLHWTLDMTFKDDASRLRTDHAPANMATLRHIALNLIQKSKIPKKSIKTMRFKAALNDQLLERILLKI